MKGCCFSPDRIYRYTLWREWDMSNDLVASQGGPGFDRTGQYLMVIGLNPSTADETNDDPTIRRCIDYAQRWGFGGLCMTNLFAYRATDPDQMKRYNEPIGLENDFHLISCAVDAGQILAAWGIHGNHVGRADRVRQLLRKLDLFHLGTNDDGSPKHPLYLKKTLIPSLYDAPPLAQNLS